MKKSDCFRAARYPDEEEFPSGWRLALWRSLAVVAFIAVVAWLV